VINVLLGGKEGGRCSWIMRHGRSHLDAALERGVSIGEQPVVHRATEQSYWVESYLGDAFFSIRSTAFSAIRVR